MYGLYGMRCWNATKCYMYDYRQHWVYCVRRWINLQYHHKRGHVYHVRRSLRSREHLSVYGLYRDHKPGVYCL